MEETAGKPQEQPGQEMVPVSATPQPASGAQSPQAGAPQFSRSDMLLLTIGGKVVFAFVAALGLASLGLIGWALYAGIRWYLNNARF